MTNLDVKFANGWIQLDANYIEVPEPKSFKCETLTAYLKSTPDKIFEMIKGYAPEVKEKLKGAFE